MILALLADGVASAQTVALVASNAVVFGVGVWYIRSLIENDRTRKARTELENTTLRIEKHAADMLRVAAELALKYERAGNVEARGAAAEQKQPQPKDGQ